MLNFIRTLIAYFSKPMPPNTDTSPQPEPVPVPVPVKLTVDSKVYTSAVACLGKHITLDASVPPDLSCAEAISYILSKSGITGIPPKGFQGTSQLYSFLKNNKQFAPVSKPQIGDIIISPTGWLGAVFEHGHVGIVGRYHILSNNSYTGTFSDSYTMETWRDFYQVRGRFPVLFFAVV